MNVKLIALTKPVDDSECKTAEQLIAYCARVSNPTNQLNHGTADKLLKYMVDHKHWSPFEMSHAVIEINTTRDIARQILRHRSFSFQEFSQRYAKVQTEPVIREARMQDEKNRQNSLETGNEILKAWWKSVQRHHTAGALGIYQEALDRGVAKEVARAVLPEGLTPSCLYMSGTIRSWIHYIQLRTGNGTQKEHQEIARACRNVLFPHFPALQELLRCQTQTDIEVGG